MISQKAWRKYVDKLAAIDKKTADQMKAWIDKNGLQDEKALIDYAYGLATKYGEASATLSCEMYDTMSDMMDAGVPEALPAETATMSEVAKGVMYGKYHSPSQIPGIVGRMVRQAGADTMIQNAKRDRAQWAWIPQGDTCAFCITLASNGWQNASSTVLNGGHADHIHQNCDCTFAISFKESDKKQYDKVYDPKKYKDMYYGADGDTPSERINYLRRQNYQQNKDEINAQKREAYRERTERSEIIESDDKKEMSYPNSLPFPMSGDNIGAVLRIPKQPDKKNEDSENEERLRSYIGQTIAEADNLSVREWYYANVHDILNQLDYSKPIEDVARQAYDLRNKYKREARIAMSNRSDAKWLEEEHPIPSYEDLIKSKMTRKGMTREEAILDILKTASKTNRSFDEEFGLK